MQVSGSGFRLRGFGLGRIIAGLLLVNLFGTTQKARSVWLENSAV